jgi:hypothetical protein
MSLLLISTTRISLVDGWKWKNFSTKARNPVKIMYNCERSKLVIARLEKLHNQCYILLTADSLRVDSFDEEIVIQGERKMTKKNIEKHESYVQMRNKVPNTGSMGVVSNTSCVG